MADEYEHELTADRDEIAAVLEGLADGVRAGSVQLGEGEDGVTIALPESAELEVEYEHEDDEASLEVELEWPLADAPASSDEHEDVEAGDDDDDAEAADDPDTDEESAASEAEAEDAPGVADDLAVPVGTTEPLQSLAKFEVFRDRGSEWRWRLRHRNGNIIATSGEGYTRKHNALKGLRSVVRNAPEAELTEDE